MRRTAAVTAARASGLASRLLGRGGGTALPGLIATTLDRHIVRDLALQLSRGAVVVSGTNGKTTTCRILAGILRGADYRPLRNDSGSNLERGLASSLVQRADLLGRLPAAGRDIGLFEVDEAALPAVLPAVNPGMLVLLDLFRDQLDRYGEVATIAAAWTAALGTFPPESTVLANADDPLVYMIAASGAGRRRYFGVKSAHGAGHSLEHASDVKACPRCGGEIHYRSVFLGHLGHFKCRECGLARPEPEVQAADIVLRGVEGSDFILLLPGEEARISFPLPGMYNVYNAVAAAAAAHALGVDGATICAALESATAAFGRMERISVEGKHAYLALAKNPAGLNEVLRTVGQAGDDAHLLVMLNDNTADGRDVSWIWDADVEMLGGRVRSVVFAGQRAEDMALRFKYAGIIEHESQASWRIEHDTQTALELALKMTDSGNSLFIIPTYTAMLDVRGVLSRLGLVRPYWEG